MPPPLDAPVVDLEVSARLPAAAAHPAPAPKAHGHDHPLTGEADIDDRRAREAQKPVECSRDAHVALLAGRLTLNSQRACRRGWRRVTAFCATSRTNPPPRKPCSANEPNPSLTPRPTGDPFFKGATPPCSHRKSGPAPAVPCVSAFQARRGIRGCERCCRIGRNGCARTWKSEAGQTVGRLGRCRTNATVAVESHLSGGASLDPPVWR